MFTYFFRLLYLIYFFIKLYFKILTTRDYSQLSSIQVLGPVPIKLAQWISQKSNIFPKHICRHLRKLQNSVEAHPISWTKKLCKGIPIKITKINPKPIGCGSMAQVHKAKYKKKNIAIKVIHPNSRSLIETDIIIFKFLIECYQSLSGVSCLQVDAFFDSVVRQANFDQEAKNTIRLAKSFKSNQMIHFPKILYYNKDVIIQSYQEGLTFRQFYQKYGKHKALQARSTCLAAYMQMWLCQGFVHGDCHDGNILYRFKPHKKNWYSKRQLQPEVIFLDCGVTASVRQELSIGLLKILPAFSNQDIPTITKFIQGIALKPTNGERLNQEIKKEVTKLRQDAKTKGVFVSKQIKALLAVIRNSNTLIDSNIIIVLIGYTLIISKYEGENGFLFDRCTNLVRHNNNFIKCRATLLKLEKIRLKMRQKN